MTVKIDIDMPEMCSDCPMFEKPSSTENNFYFMGTPFNGKCKVLPIKDYGSRVVTYQTVSTCSEIKNHCRSPFCPLKEVK